MEKTLTIKTKLRFKDTLKYHLYIAFNSVANLVFLALSLTSLGMFIYNMINGKGTVDVRFAQSFVLLIPPFIFLINVPVKIWKATQNLLKNSVLKDEVVYTFRLDQISFQTSEAQADVKWENYIKIVETSYDFRFFIDRVQAQLIPKYSLSKEEISLLRRMIKEAAGPDKIKLKES